MPSTESGFWELSRDQTRDTEFPGAAQILALPATAGEPPMGRSWEAVRGDLLALFGSEAVEATTTTMPFLRLGSTGAGGAVLVPGVPIEFRHTDEVEGDTILAELTFTLSPAPDGVTRRDAEVWLQQGGAVVSARASVPVDGTLTFARLALTDAHDPDSSDTLSLQCEWRAADGDAESILWFCWWRRVTAISPTAEGVLSVIEIVDRAAGLPTIGVPSTGISVDGRVLTSSDSRPVWEEGPPSWARAGSSARIPRDRLQPPTAGLSGERIALYFGLESVELPLSQVGTDPDADRAGTMSAAQVRKLQDLVKITPRGAWNGNQREYGVGDLVHRQYDNHAISAIALAEHSSTSQNGPTASGNALWATLLAVPRPDWNAAAGSPAAIRNQPPVPGAITERMLLFDDDGIHAGYGGNYWHRTSVVASSIPAGSEVAFEFPYTWSPTPRLWSHWPGAPTEVATESWLRDVTPDGGGATIDRIPAPDSSFVVGGDAHYHPFGYVNSAEAPRQMEIREIALIVDAANYLCFCTRTDPPTVGDHPNAARATGIRMLWRSS